MVSADAISRRAMPHSRIAVVVPVLHDAAALSVLAADLSAQTRRPDEVIVVDGAADADVRAVAIRHGYRYVATHALRGLQLDAGARAARADVLWFVHADARLPENACAAIDAACSNGADGGCLRFAFQGRPTLIKRVIAALARLRVACGGIAYGDQALFFTRTSYTASGGFPHTGLFEEVPIQRHLRHGGSFVPLPVPVFVSCRRFERDGWVRRSLHNRWLAVRHALGAAPQSLARAYETADAERDG